jgi:hypothetical protein
MPPFLVSVISSADHWLFVSSSGGLTAGRVSPESALFPYVTVDKLHDAAPHTGCKTILRVGAPASSASGSPSTANTTAVTPRAATSTRASSARSCASRRSTTTSPWRSATPGRPAIGTASCATASSRTCGSDPVQVELVDGLQNVLPAGTPGVVQASASNLVNAYKWTELDRGSRLALYALYAAISDRAEPCESLRANVVYGLGLERATVLLSSLQLDDFRRGAALVPEITSAASAAAISSAHALELPRGGSQRWQIVADVERTQAQVVDLIRSLADPAALPAKAGPGIRGCRPRRAGPHRGHRGRLPGGRRGGRHGASLRQRAVQRAARRRVRRPVPRDRGRLRARASGTSTGACTSGTRVCSRASPRRSPGRTCCRSGARAGDPQLERLCHEYLPITFGRRHGDPSRPWNRFSIRVRAGRPAPALLRRQLARHLPELGGARAQFPGVHRAR